MEDAPARGRFQFGCCGERYVSGGGECLDQPGCSEQVQHAFEVVGHDSDADFGAGP